jgi:hypothetical protein
MPGEIMHSRNIATTVSVLAAILGMGAAAHAQNDGPIGTVSQPLVGGTLVSPETQRAFGLLSLSSPTGSCSASMLNAFWAITAAHCVYPSITAPSAIYPANQITLTSNWPGNSKTATARQVIAFNGFPFSQGSDIALLQMGPHDFDRLEAKDQVIAKPGILNNLTLLAFGRGIYQLAYQSGQFAVPSQSDGQFRSGEFTTGGVLENALTPPPLTVDLNSANGIVVAGGDSGGPSYFQAWDDASSPRRKLEWRLLGVHHLCQTRCLAGQNCTASWKYVSQILSCSDASVLPVWQRITDTIQDSPVDDSPGTFSTSVPPAVLQHKRALYAVSIDEPLLASPNAAVDIQLPFKQCHSVLRAGGGGCPLDPSLQIWGYDLATHRVLHVPSGKCLNISGARRDAGAPIILYPCSGAPNEKWTVAAIGGGSSWTIKSDLTAQCLSAIPGRSASSGRGPGVTLATPALLAQMPCTGSNGQLFTDADAAWATRNGPH